MRLIILEREDLVGEWSAKYVVKRINEFKANENRHFVLGLPTGMYISCNQTGYKFIVLKLENLGCLIIHTYLYSEYTL